MHQSPYVSYFVLSLFPGQSLYGKLQYKRGQLVKLTKSSIDMKHLIGLHYAV